MKIGLPGSYEANRTDPMAHHVQVSEAFRNNPTKQILNEIETPSNEFKTTDQKVKEVFGLK